MSPRKSKAIEPYGTPLGLLGRHRQKSSHDGIIGIVLLPDAFDRAIKRGEQASPNAEVTTKMHISISLCLGEPDLLTQTQA